MEDLIEFISKSKNFYGPDIEMKDYLESIPYQELKSIKDHIMKHMDNFFKDDKGEVIGYYLCRGVDVFKFYIMKVNNKIYMALDSVPPFFWYEIKTHSDFKNVRRSYNKKGDTFKNKMSKLCVSFSLNNTLTLQSDSGVQSDYEKIMLLANMCLENPFTSDSIFGSNELYDRNMNMKDMNAIEKAHLNKYIIEQCRGFNVRTLYSQSIINVKCNQGIYFLTFYFNPCPILENVNDIPIDVYLFMLNFNIMGAYDVISKKDEDLLKHIACIMPVDFFSDMRFNIYRYLLEIDNPEKEDTCDDSYLLALKLLFTNYTVHKILLEHGDELKDLNSNADMIDAILQNITEEEFKYILKDEINKISFDHDKNDEINNIPTIGNLSSISEEPNDADIISGSIGGSSKANSSENKKKPIKDVKYKQDNKSKKKTGKYKKGNVSKSSA
jgi:hypothetical protein